MTDTVRRIEEVREQRKMSRAKMCRLAGGLAPTSYSNYITRGNEPPIEVIEAIAHALNTTVAHLRTGATVGNNLEAEMRALTEKVATLPKSTQERIINTMNDLVDTYKEAHHV